jgi:hypothetical protein
MIQDFPALVRFLYSFVFSLENNLSYARALCVDIQLWVLLQYQLYQPLTSFIPS